ncbi:MAG: PilZ domain-containing protein [Deltaproteobacteria bacterium]|nr:PilZ domain-containing protein [Deltaproteobacteria bacterium]
MSTGDTMGIIRLSYELAYLEARHASKMPLTSKEWSRLGTLRPMLARDPAYRRRTHRRFAIKARGTAQVDGLSIGVEINEISAGGCRIIAPVALRAGTEIKLSIELRRVTFVFNAEVKRVVLNGDKATLGLSFSGIPLELRRFRTRPPSLFDQRLTEAAS